MLYLDATQFRNCHTMVKSVFQIVIVPTLGKAERGSDSVMFFPQPLSLAPTNRSFIPGPRKNLKSWELLTAVSLLRLNQRWEFTSFTLKSRAPSDKALINIRGKRVLTQILFRAIIRFTYYQVLKF